MITVTIYDDRDKESDEPGSSLGASDTLQEGIQDLLGYLKQFPQHTPHIYKIELTKEGD